jgi:hypothetical protein
MCILYYSGDLTLDQPTALEGCDGIIMAPESVKVSYYWS